MSKKAVGRITALLIVVVIAAAGVVAAISLQQAPPTTIVTTQTVVRPEETTITQTQVTTVVTERTVSPTTPAPLVPANLTVIYSLTGAFRGLDPTGGWTYESLIQAYERLVEWDYYANKPVPELALSWTPNSDFTEWTFTLRRGVKFHDGTPFNATAVEWSFDRAARHRFGNAQQVTEPIEKVTVLDTYTVKFKTKYPLNLPQLLSVPIGAYISSPNTHLRLKLADDTQALINWHNQGNSDGTGPYVSDPSTYDATKQLVLRRFKDYWGGWVETKASNIIVKVMPDLPTSDRAVAEGLADVTPQNSIAYTDARLFIGNPTTNLHVFDAMNNVYLQFNMKKAPLDNVKVRQALSYAVPYDQIIRDVAHGYAVRTPGPITFGTSAFDPAMKGYLLDMEKAKALLAEAGYPAGLNVKFRATYAVGHTWVGQMFELIRPYWRQLGVEIEAQPVPFGTMVDIAMGTNPQDILGTDWRSFYQSSYPNLYDRFHSGAFFDYSYYANKEYESLIDTARSLEPSDMKRANELYKQAAEIWLKEAPAVTVWTAQYLIAINKRWSTPAPNPADWGVQQVYNWTYVGE
jgi:peptide/nickel transport system substrate-binding protein